MQIKFRRRSKEYCRRRDLLLSLEINCMLKITFFFLLPVLKFFNFGKPKKNDCSAAKVFIRRADDAGK